MTKRASVDDSRALEARRPARPERDEVVTLPVRRDDAAIVRGLRAGEVWARAAFFDRCAPAVERVLSRILGVERHDTLADLVHDTFAAALGSIEKLRDPAALVGWMQAIAAHTACHAIRARRSRRWLRFWAPADVPDICVDGLDPEVAEAHQHTYVILERMPTDERVAFALRFIDGMELEAVARVCGVSLSTIKRRLSRAEERFVRAAARDETLRPWLEGGGRWTST